MKTRARRTPGSGLGSLHGRMVIAMLASAALVLPVVLLALLYIRRMNDALGRIADRDIEVIQIGDRVSLGITEARREDKNYLLYRDSSSLARSREALDRVEKLAAAGQLIDPEAAADFDSITQLTRRYRVALDTLLVGPITDPGGRPLQPGAWPPVVGSRNGLDDTLNLIQLRITAASDTVIARSMQRIDEHRTGARRLATWGQRNIITVLLLTMALLLWLLIVLPRRAVLPIKRLTNALRRAEAGDLEIRVKAATDDELGNLARQLNRSFARLREFDEQKTDRILQLEKRFRLLINDISEGIIVVDRTPTILLANPAVEELLGRPVAEVQGRKLPSCPELAFLAETLERALAGATGHQTCDIMPELPGSAVCIEALRNRAGEITGALIIIGNPQRPQPRPVEDQPSEADPGAEPVSNAADGSEPSAPSGQPD